MIRRILLAATMLLTGLGFVGVTNVANAPTAGALSHPGLTCYSNWHPIAPNVVKYCVGWINSGGYPRRVEASHHVGWWGGNYDPGRWRILVDKYTPGGGYIQQDTDATVNDSVTPDVRTDTLGWSYVNFIPNNWGGEPQYNNNDCPNTQWTGMSQYYPEHPQYWVIGDNYCNNGNGWKNAPNMVYTHAAGSFGYPSSYAALHLN